MNTRLCAAAAIALAAAVAGSDTPAHAADVQAGTLNCNVAGGWGFILGSSKDLNCIFSPAGGAAPERYTGSITKVGVDIGYTSGGVILWAVFAPSSSIPSGALAGNYAGATAEVTAGGGVGANVLVGGGGNSIALQPVSITGQEGLNVAAGIGAINLTYVP